jgi:hypothetical protein
MILSTTGNASSSSFTIENSCSGPRTSRVLYVKAPLLLELFSTIEYKATFKHVVQVRKQRVLSKLLHLTVTWVAGQHVGGGLLFAEVLIQFPSESLLRDWSTWIMS